MAAAGLSVLSFGSSDTGNASADSVDDFAGDYVLEVISLTDVGSDGGSCGDASGDVAIADGVVTGTALSTNGSVYTIGGSVEM